MRDWRWWVALVLIVGAIAAIQHVTPVDRTHWHYIFPRLYYFPIVFAALYHGWRGGLAIALLSSAAFFQQFLFSADLFTERLINRYLELISFCTLAVLTGVYTDRERQQKKKYQELASKLSEVYETLQTNFEGMKRAERLSAIGHLSAGLAHEIRNPLASILGAASILRRNLPSDEKLDRCVDIIDAECQRLNRLLTDFLNFARPRFPSFQQTNLRSLLTDVIQLAEHALARKRITFTEQIIDALPQVECDPDQLRQVLLNLVINAIEASPDGATVTLAADAEENRIMIRVVDEGSGVAPEHIEKVIRSVLHNQGIRYWAGPASRTSDCWSDGWTLVGAKKRASRYDILSCSPSKTTQRRMTKTLILVVDDDDNLRWVVQTQLEDAGFEVATAADGPAALGAIQASRPALVLTDLKMPGMSGLELLERIRADEPELPVIIITAFGTIQNAVEAVKNGAYDYLTKPIDHDDLILAIRRALDHTHLIQEVRALRESLDRKYGFENIIGHSEALVSVLEMAGRAARSNSTILIRAETGTGKELLAKAIHFNSLRKDKPFVTINCGAIPRELLESELFGHVKGSFTGAMANKKGRMELADGGTLFLDEIGEMPPELQVKLLRLVQQGEIEKVGAIQPVEVDVRIIAATHRDLKAMIEDGTFREDLYYRLAVIPLSLPPLRDRTEDIPDLVQHFFVRTKEKVGRPDSVLPASLMKYFQNYRWPGNIRELENVIERIVVLSRDEEITDLPDFLRQEHVAVDTLQLNLPPQGISLEAVEKELIERALKKFNWNQTQTARYLDVSRKALMYRIEKHGIRRSGHDIASQDRDFEESETES